ncbi:MAG TPA: hypothetical protein PK993_01780 [Clostridia bacterium]|nr:hypothetical protein [Clostridia bacterium]
MPNSNTKKLEIVNGNGEIEISPVRKHLELEKPKSSPEKEKIIIPSEKNTKKQ